MFWPLEELIHAYFARTWPIATCENQHPASKDPSASVSDKLRQDPDQADNLHPRPPAIASSGEAQARRAGIKSLWE